MNQNDTRILVVDDDADVARGTTHLLRWAGYTAEMVLSMPPNRHRNQEKRLYLP